MATSVMMNSDNNGYHTNTSLQPLPENHDQYSQPIRRSAGRRKMKNGEQKKKEAQRGMGVEKLEKLRIAEILKNPAANNSSFSDPNLSLNSCTPFQYSKLGGFGTPNGQMGLNQLGFHGGSLVSDPINTGVFGIRPGSSCASFGSKSGVSEISKELSSNTNAAFKCQSEYCSPNSCNKKKRFNGGNLGFGARVKPNMNNIQMCSAADCGLLGLSVGDNQNVFNQENLSPGFKTHLVHQVGYAIRPGQPGVEVLAVHKKVSSSPNQENESLVMEYEFFPGYRKESKNDELVMMKQNMVGSIEAASLGDEETCLGIGAPGPGSDAASTSSIDLSLKLSY